MIATLAGNNPAARRRSYLQLSNRCSGQPRKSLERETQPVCARGRTQYVTLVTILHMNFLLCFITVRLVSAKIYFPFRNAQTAFVTPDFLASPAGIVMGS
jgi:hypothetical protein